MANDVTSLSLRPGSAEKLARLAERRGIKQTRGAGASLGLPSITGFVDAIARGEYVAIRPADGDWQGLLDALDLALQCAQRDEHVSVTQCDLLNNLLEQIKAEAHIVYVTPPHVLDAVAGSGAFLAQVAEQIIGNPPYGEMRKERDAAENPGT